MGTAEEQQNRLLLRARDRIDLRYREPLDVAALAAVACMSPAHFTRSFKAAFGETPHRYLQRRRIERAMERLRRSDHTISDIGIEVGWNSFATFSRTFREVVGCSPSEYRATAATPAEGRVPTHYVKAWSRPSSAAAAGPGGPGATTGSGRPAAPGASSSSGTADGGGHLHHGHP